MLKYTNYDTTTGRIIQSGVCPDESCLPSKPVGSDWLFGVMYNPDTQAVRLSDKQPIPYVAVVAATSAVNEERDRRIALGFAYADRMFQVNVPNISAALSSATAATLNGSPDGDLRWYDPMSDFGWIAMDNSILTMDARTMIMFGQTATAFNSSFYTAARTIKNRILAGETLNITDNSLWPPSQTV